MRTAATSLILLALAAGTSEAQGRGRGNSQGIPPGQMPRAGECRVWIDGLPPGRQPAPTNCDQAERVASRNRNARVIYGDNRIATATGAIAIARMASTIAATRTPIRTAATRATATTACRTTTDIATAWRRAARTRRIAIRTILFATAGIAPAIAATTAATERRSPTSSRIVTASRPATSKPTGAGTGPPAAALPCRAVKSTRQPACPSPPTLPLPRLSWRRRATIAAARSWRQALHRAGAARGIAPAVADR